MSKTLVDKMERADVPTIWIAEVKQMLRQIARGKAELETRIEIIDKLAKEREDLVKILINTVNAIDRAWSREDLQYNTETMIKIVAGLDNFLVRLENNNGRKRTE